MPKLLAITKVVRTKDDQEELIPAGAVFDATVEEAHMLDGIGAARPATADEIAHAKKQTAIADGSAFVAPASTDATADDTEVATSAAHGDPKALPKGKNA